MCIVGAIRQYSCRNLFGFSTSRKVFRTTKVDTLIPFLNFQALLLVWNGGGVLVLTYSKLYRSRCTCTEQDTWLLSCVPFNEFRFDNIVSRDFARAQLSFCLTQLASIRRLWEYGPLVKGEIAFEIVLNRTHLMHTLTNFRTLESEFTLVLAI